MLEVKGIHYSYGDSEVLKDATLQVNRCEIVAMVGPNGSGKSTLLKIINGILKPSKGTIKWDGTDLTHLSPNAISRLIATVPQDKLIPDGFTTFDLVMMGRMPYLGLWRGENSHDFEIASYAMRSTHTIHLASKRLNTLSGGEQQRAFLAMALAQETQLLLLDEPTASLDLAYQVALMNTITKVKAEKNSAVLTAIHDINIAAQYCDRILMLKHGRIWKEGTPSEILTQNNIYDVYGARVQIIDHPESGLPVVVPV